MNNGHYSVDIDIFRTMKRRKARLIGERESPRAILTGKKGSGPEPIPIGLNQRTARLVINKTGIADHHSPADTSDKYLLLMVSSIVDSTGFSRWSNIPSIFNQTHTNARHLSEYTQIKFKEVLFWVNGMNEQFRKQNTMYHAPSFYMWLYVQIHVSWTWLWKVTFQNRTWDCQHL